MADEAPADTTLLFETERPRLVGLAGRILSDHAEAQDVVQQAWLRLDRTDAEIDNLPAWLTTVTTRLCLDRLRARTPVPEEDLEPEGVVADPAEEVALADSVGVALQVVLDRLSPRERVAFVLHDTFGFDFATIGAVLEATPTTARKLASRARTKVRPSSDEAVDQAVDGDGAVDWQVVDAFMAAAREGEFDRLLALLAPNAEVSADAAAIGMGTPESITGRQAVAEFFNGSAKAALPAQYDGRAAAAWYHRGTPMVLFDFTVVDGLVTAIRFRAEPEVLAEVVRR